MDERWTINRIGLINFWYYDEEEFHFKDGRLLLRGSNGSGKSVTMQSFIPLLLDGNKSPERLDPFGSRARRLENYLLDEDDVGIDERIGYLYMELVKEDAGVYLTIGMGLRARKGKTMDFWGFAITDGRRIGKDFFLYKEVGEKIPFSKIELRNRIGEGGEIQESQRDYMAMVNRMLFGFEMVEDYDELIKLLIQLRTPKLSKGFKPTIIYEIMNNSLQPLSDEDLRPMSEAIENMDNIKSQLDVLKESEKSAELLKREYDRYNDFILTEKAQNFVESQKGLTSEKKELDISEKSLKENQENFEKTIRQIEELRSSQKILEHKKQQLEDHDAFKAKQEMDRTEKILVDLNQQKEEKEINIKDKKGRERVLNSRSNEVEEEIELFEDKIKQILKEMYDLAYDFYFHEHAFAQEEIIRNLSGQYDYSYLKNEIDRYREKISKGKKILEEEYSQRKEYDNLLQQLDHAKKEKEMAENEVGRCTTLLEEEKDELVEQLYLWNKQNTELKLSQDAMVNTTRLMRSFGQRTSYDDIIEEIRKEYSIFGGNFHKEVATLESKKQDYQQQLQDKQQELEQWQTKKDPQPIREEKVIANRKMLKKMNIPHIPLYKGVDFAKEVSDDMKGQIEEALMDMGLLDALIIPKQYEDKVLKMDKGMADKYIFSQPQYLTYELSTYLKPEQVEDYNITGVEIEEALKSIMLDSGQHNTYINENGEYGLGILCGRVSHEYVPKFIGQQARKRYKEEIIEKIKEEINIIKDYIMQQDIQIQELERRLNQLNNEYKNIPVKDNVETALNMLNSARMTLDNRQEEVERKEITVEKSYKVLKSLGDKIREYTAGVEIPLNIEGYGEAQENAENYREMLRELETEHIRLVQLFIQGQNIKEQIEEVLKDIDNLLYDLTRINRSVQENSQIIENYKELLKQTDYEEIKKEIEECILGLNTIPQKIEDEVRLKERYNNRIQTRGKEIEKLKINLIKLETVFSIYKEAFKKEYELGYVFQRELTMDDNIYEVGKEVYEQLKAEGKQVKTLEDYISNLQQRFHENRPNMTEYNLTIRQLFEDTSYDEDIEIQTILAKQKRLEIMGRIQGRDVSFYKLVDFIKQSIEENEKILKESDRQLFEDILANTVSKKIRAKIYHAERWVKKMNDLMESMNTSSGLSFSLMWKSKVAEDEEQMDTKELVNILKSDVNLLREEDFSKLSIHFRSKIAQARKSLEDSDFTRTFHTIMKEILDYRQWFEFRLFYKKTGETRKELTNNAFDRFSGGEKAMAMYVPLFSAVYARYEGARKDCPRIISLDEAFAGVDENNIRDMFRLLEELKLNFIINSQILWGDYDTVPALSICELIRPNNSKVVTVIRYLWDGKTRKLVV